MPTLKIFFPKVYGFCGGVTSAIEIVSAALLKYGAPLYVHHAIVHNEHVSEDFKSRGVIFIDDLSEITDKTRPLVLSAHGSPRSLLDEIKKLGITYIDATCPLVLKVHEYVRAKSELSHKIVVIGNSLTHQEVVGTMGQSENTYFVANSKDVQALKFDACDKVSYVSQTTLAEDEVRDVVRALKEKFPNIEGLPEGNVCRATTLRQHAVRELIIEEKLDDFIIIGSSTSSNTKNLLHVALLAGAKNVRLISSGEDVKESDFVGIKKLGITAGASTPQYVIDDVLARLKKLAS